jgi:hypothetical protein
MSTFVLKIRGSWVRLPAREFTFFSLKTPLYNGLSDLLYSHVAMFFVAMFQEHGYTATGDSEADDT